MTNAECDPLLLRTYMYLIIYNIKNETSFNFKHLYMFVAPFKSFSTCSQLSSARSAIVHTIIILKGRHTKRPCHGACTALRKYVSSM